MKEMIGNIETLSNLGSLTSNVYGHQNNVSLKLKESTNDYIEPATGYRIAMTHNAIRNSFNTHEVIYGELTSDSISNGIAIFDNLFEPQIIASLLFIVNEDIYPSANIDEILKKTKFASGIEILDSHIKNWYPNQSIVEMMSDKSLVGKVIIGNPVKISSVKSFEKIKVKLTCDSEVVNMGSYKDVVVNPLESINWLISKLAFEGKFLKKGMIIATGSYTIPKALYKGEYRADFGLLGEVSLRVR